jgi:hypothetical protein
MMKQIYDWPLAIVALVVMVMACSDMNELHQPFLDRGELIYAAKVDSVATHPGKNRIQFDMVVQSQRIKIVRIYWNDYKNPDSDVIKFKDSSDLDISGKGIFKKIVDNLDERSYTFKLVSFDEFGNPSLPTEIHAYVYGPKYEKLLVARSMRSTGVDTQGNLRITWGLADGAYASEVRYTDVADQLKVRSFPIAESVSLISDIKGNTAYEFRTVYKPDTTGIDNFYTEYIKVDPPFAFDKSDWDVIAFSTQHNGADNSVDNFIDGTDATRWHSCAGCSSYPHQATIDMAIVRTITQFSLWITTFENPGGDHRAPDRVQFLVSMDNTSWTDLGEFDLDRYHVGEQKYPLNNGVQARYFKFVAVSGPVNDQMVIGEISTYGF